MSELKKYQGPGRSVVVYDTYADGGRIHFDVFLITDKDSVGEVPASFEATARRVAEEFLAKIGASKAQARIERCRKCHIDDTSVYEGQLWDFGEALIWPMEGCPKPS